MEARLSLGQDVVSWWQSKTASETLREKVVVRQFARANHRVLEGVDAELYSTNTEHDLEVKKEADERKLHRMAKVHNVLEMWQGSQNLCAIQTESHAHNKQMTTAGYIPDTEQIIKAFLSLFQHDGAAAFKLSETSPLLPTLTAKNLPGGRTQILIVGQINKINHRPVEGDEHSPPEHISDTEDRLNWNGDLHNAYNSKDDCVAQVESGKVQGNAIKDLRWSDKRNVSAAPNVPGFIWPTRKSNRQAEKALVMVNAIVTRRNSEVNKW
jgi:hypothetical protein